MNKIIKWLVPIVIGLGIWFTSNPVGVTPQAWHLFAIFAGTIIAFITQPLPIGALSIISVTLCALTNTLPIDDVLSGYSNSTIWLIVAAFLFSRGFIKTGLGSRIAYTLITWFGKSSLTLAYALALSDLILAPATPSNTARAGGVLQPITLSLAKAFGSTPEDGTSRKIGAFLIASNFQVNAVTSAMFMTAMAGNTLVATLADKSFGIQLSWGEWALAAIVPGLISLVIMPYFVYKTYAPELKETPQAKAMAKEELHKLGSMTMVEKIMFGVFLLSLVLWATATITHVSATTVALLGVSILLATKVLTWSDVTGEKGAWDTMVWMGTLIALAGQLSKLGFIKWFATMIGGSIGDVNWLVGFAILLVVYTYIHYIFASLSAHIAAFYVAFATVAISIGTPVYFALLGFAFFSNLCMSLTHYSAGPSPILFGAGYISQNKWWSLGFAASIINLVVWLGIGSMWWSVLGLL